MDTSVNFAILNDELAAENDKLKARIEQLEAEIEQLITINEHLLAQSNFNGGGAENLYRFGLQHRQ